MFDHLPHLKQIIKNCYFFFLRVEVFIKSIIWGLFRKEFPAPEDIPIIINNFNRLSMLKRLLASLEERNYHNIIILDNNSTYPPLLEFYESNYKKYEIIHLGQNYGFLALWKKPGLYDRFKRNFYVYTDPDLEIDKGCPSDFMSFFLETLKKHPDCQKIGFGIRIDNLPNHYKEKESVIQWEKQHWEIPYGDRLFKARIDTTFALYRPFCKGGHSSHLVFRTGAPYLIRHLPWYQDSSNLSEEDIYYISNSRQSTMWTSKSKL